MSSHNLVHKLLSLATLMAMLIAPVGSLSPRAAARVSTGRESVSVGDSLLYRTSVVLRQPRDLARLEKLDVVVLGAPTASRLPATVVVLTEADQLETLARLRFEPRSTDDLGFLIEAHVEAQPWLAASLQPLLDQVAAAQQRIEGQQASREEVLAELRASMRALTAEQKEGIAVLASEDNDDDGLTNTEEAWWCTDPDNPNSDGDAQGYTDGKEVYALLDFTLPRSVRWGYGPPFGPPAPWPAWNQPGGCNDGDYDTIPDFAEAYMVGSKVPEETTDLDKFDDGQELFGLTYCPGAPTSCGYGNYPRIEYWNYIKATMPTWVRPPGDNLFVAAFPIPEVSVVPGSWTVERVTTITTEEGEIVETTHSYETSVTRGQSTSIANTVTWNEWEEVSQAVETPLGLTDVQPSIAVPWPLIWQGVSWVGTKALEGIVAGVTWDTIKNLFTGKDKKDDIQPPQTYPPQSINVSSSAEAYASIILNQSFDFSGVASSLDGVQYAISQQGELLARGLYDVSYAIQQPRYTETRTSGRSWGGAQTVTNEVYEEHTITEGEAFTSGRNWSTAWAVDSSHAADLTFNYTIQNTGAEYARELTGLIFNVYLGDDPNPIISYPAWQQFPDGKLENVFPGDTYNFASTAIVLSLEQMERIDLGEHLTLVLEDYSYGADELFYQDAVNGGVTVFIEDGVDDGDELVDSYVIPTWGTESVQDVLTRYIPASTDGEGNLDSLLTPEFDGINPPIWHEHFLSDIAWWNVYLTQDDAGDTPLHELPAQAGGAILFRFNRDSDRDGYQDRVEMRYYCALPPDDPDHPYCGTDADSAQFRPEIHPQPEVLAGYTATRDGNVVIVLLKLANFGTFDAYGVDAVMYAPDATVTIGNNTVGGNGRVRPGDQVAVGSLILPPNLDNWTSSTAKVYAAGNYTGDADKIFTFATSTPGVVGQGSTALSWSDGAGGSGTLDLGSSYHAPLPTDVADGLQIGCDTGTALAGESFTVQALTPRDTFTFTIESEPYTEPVIVVSYSDPQGSHKFITPVELFSLAEDLSAYSGQMLPDVGVEVVTTGAVDATGSNTTYFIVNSPHPEPIENAHLYLNFVADGELVTELPYTMTMQPGPTVYPVEWSTSVFSQTYDADADNILIAFWTDAQGNIIDSAARPLNTFQADPTPEVHASGLTWDLGVVTQGAVLDHSLALANTGLTDMQTWVPQGEPVALQEAATSLNINPADVLTVPLTLDTGSLPTGTFSQTLTIRTSDLDQPTLALQVTGEISPLSGAAASFVVPYRPWDQYVYVPGPHDLSDTVTFDHTIPDDPDRIHPLYVYTEDDGTLLGVGEYGPDFTGQTAPFGMFGDGRDGIMPSSGNLDYDQGFGIGTANGSIGSNDISVTDQYAVWRINPGDNVLIHQTRGSGAGNWELNQALSDFTGSGTFVLSHPLAHSYVTDGGQNRAQILRVPQYSECPVAGTVSPLSSWNGTYGGIFAVMCSRTFNLSGNVTVNGGNGWVSTGDQQGAGIGGGFRGGNNSSDGSGAWAGEGHIGNYGTETTLNQGNGGGGAGGHDYGLNDGAGGGNGTQGGNGSAGQPSTPLGGSAVGNPDLSSMFMGGGAGGGRCDTGGSGGAGGGGAGGGIVVIFARNLQISGSINANGGSGGDGCADGGGGAGGSILIKAGTASLGSSVTALGGVGPGLAGEGGIGRIRIEYCNSPTGTTNPPASTQQLTCYIARQLPGSPNTELILPEAITDFARYHIQYGQRGTFTDSMSSQEYHVTLPKRTYDAVTLDALFEGLDNSTFNFTVDVGADGSVEWSGNGTEQPVILSSRDLSAGLNAYLATTPEAWGAEVTIPISVTLDTLGDVFLTNLVATPAPDSDAMLTAADISFSDSSPNEGDHVTVQAVVSNAEAFAATNIIAAFFAGDPEAGGIYLGADFLPIIPPNSAATATLDWDTEGFGGNVDLYVILDPTNQVAETNEDNNRAFKSIFVRSYEVFLPLVFKDY